MVKSEHVSELFAKRLSMAMEARGFTGSSLARTAGLSHCTIYAYLEQTRLPRLDFLVALAETLGVGLDWLVCRKGSGKRGAWLPQGDALGEMCKCSECGAVQRNFGRDRYCRECGTKMFGLPDGTVEVSKGQ